MKQEISVPIRPLKDNVIDEVLINVPETQLVVVQAFNRGVRLVKNNSFVLHVVIILVNTHLTHIILPPWCNGSIPDSGSGGGGSSPSGAVYMEFVAERLRRKFVALVNAGSNPVKLPEMVG